MYELNCTLQIHLESNVVYSETSDKRHSLLRTQYKNLCIKDRFFAPNYIQLSYEKGHHSINCRAGSEATDLVAWGEM